MRKFTVLVALCAALIALSGFFLSDRTFAGSASSEDAVVISPGEGGVLRVTEGTGFRNCLTPKGFINTTCLLGVRKSVPYEFKKGTGIGNKIDLISKNPAQPMFRAGLSVYNSTHLSERAYTLELLKECYAIKALMLEKEIEGIRAYMAGETRQPPEPTPYSCEEVIESAK